MPINNHIRVFCDFDGTITVRDTVDLLLTELADPEWEAIEDEWVRGLIGSRECMERQVGLIKGGWQAVQEILDEVKVDDHFNEFAKWCNANGIPLVVVSDGLDRVIAYLLGRIGVSVDTVYANRLLEHPGNTLSLEFPFQDRLAGCQSGVCKCKVLSQTEGTAVKTVIGDGRSDYCWSSRADVLFAKAKLAEHCTEMGFEHSRFETFRDVHEALVALADRRIPRLSGDGLPCPVESPAPR